MGVIVGEALSENQAADDVGHCAAQEERGVEGLAWVQGERKRQLLSACSTAPSKHSNPTEAPETCHRGDRVVFDALIV